MVEKSFGILVCKVLLGTMVQRPKVVRDIVFTCVVLYNMLRIHQGGANRTPTPANDVVALQNEQAVYVPNDNYRDLLREAKHKQGLLKDYFSHVGALARQEDRISDVSTNNPGCRSWHLLFLFRTTIIHFRTTQ